MVSYATSRPCVVLSGGRRRDGARPRRLRMSLPPVFEALPIAFAEAWGMFDAEGLSVELVGITDNQERSTALLTGNLDAVMSDVTSAVLDYLTSRSVVVVASAASTPQTGSASPRARVARRVRPPTSTGSSRARKRSASPTGRTRSTCSTSSPPPTAPRGLGSLATRTSTTLCNSPYGSAPRRCPWPFCPSRTARTSRRSCRRAERRCRSLSCRTSPSSPRRRA